MINTTIQSFTIQKKIGSGGMATVYLAENDIGKKVAIKVLNVNFFNNDSARKRFVQEAKVMAQLQHPNICGVISMQETADFAVIIMEYLEGQDLSDYVTKNGTVTESLAYNWLGQIAKALDYAHSKEVIHRDIKPSNFFLTSDGQIKIMDFGIAKVQDSLVNTQTNSRMGSVVYMSPEQIKSPKYVSYKTDIYSLGVSLHHLLSGEFPYDITTQSEYNVMEKIINDPLPELKISDKLSHLIQTATQKDPDKRPKSLKAWLEGEKIRQSNPNNNDTLYKEHANTKTVILEEPEAKRDIKEDEFNTENNKSGKTKWLIALAAFAGIALLSLGIWYAVISTPDPEKPDPVIVTDADSQNTSSEEEKPNIETVLVEGGTFTMGCKAELDKECEDDEKPAHKVTLNSFKMSKYEITNAEYAQFLNDKGNQKEGGENWIDINSKSCEIIFTDGVFKAKEGKSNHPVVMVTWYGATAFADWIGGRLPREAEWEFASIGGNERNGFTKYAGSNNLDKVGWFWDNARSKTQPVGTKMPNQLGLSDMSGNVMEWCSDWKRNYSNSPKTNPAGNVLGTHRVVRGGTCLSTARFCRVTERVFKKPNASLFTMGFRVVFD